MDSIVTSLGIGLVVGLILLAMITAFIPVIIASNRKHPQTWLIFFVVLLTSWTTIGWFIALIWSLLPFDKVEKLKTELTAEEKLAELDVLFNNNVITEDDYKETRTKIFEDIVNKKPIN